MNDFKPFEDKLAGLIAALSPDGRRRMTSILRRNCASGNSSALNRRKRRTVRHLPRVSASPSGQKRGRIKREMFVKLRTNRYLKASGNDSAAVVEFTGKVQRIARVHQFGLIDNPSPKYNKVKYIERELLGFSICDNKFINELIIKFLDG